MNPTEPMRLFTIRINSKSYTVAAVDLFSAAIKATRAFELVTGRDFNPSSDRFDGSHEHKPRPNV